MNWSASNLLNDAGHLRIAGGGTLAIGASAVTLSNITLPDGSITGLGGGVLTVTGQLEIGAGTISAKLAGSGSLTKVGAGLFTLTGDHTFSGPITLNGGATRFAGSIASSISFTPATSFDQSPW
ncbi:MAG TPA: autotransporter-associated beta strand repeat-containing protein, partial [Pirellulaceae bacterium]|nr:autotransporter-associated beta strand repeat-containing protein [Pirellulaceae bacterium]